MQRCNYLGQRIENFNYYFFFTSLLSRKRFYFQMKNCISKHPSRTTSTRTFRAWYYFLVCWVNFSLRSCIYTYLSLYLSIYLYTYIFLSSSSSTTSFKRAAYNRPPDLLDWANIIWNRPLIISVGEHAVKRRFHFRFLPFPFVSILILLCYTPSPSYHTCSLTDLINRYNNLISKSLSLRFFFNLRFVNVSLSLPTRFRAFRRRRSNTSCVVQ